MVAVVVGDVGLVAADRQAVDGDALGAGANAHVVGGDAAVVVAAVAGDVDHLAHRLARGSAEGGDALGHRVAHRGGASHAALRPPQRLGHRAHVIGGLHHVPGHHDVPPVAP